MDTPNAVRGTAAPLPGESATHRCAGVRNALMNDWQRAFPLEAAPFQPLARDLGATVREVLALCRSLGAERVLEGIHIDWSEAMHRVRWRVFVDAASPHWRQSVAQLPGAAGWDEVLAVGPGLDPEAATAAAAGLPGAWFDLVAHEPAGARAQWDWLAARLPGAVCIPVQGGAIDPGEPCECLPLEGPCADPDLARLCEAGLPLVTYPYRALSQRARRTEREVMASLRRWHRNGHVARVGLRPPAARSEQPWTLAALPEEALDPRRRAALLAQPGIGEVAGLPRSTTWPWGTVVGVPGTWSQAGDALLRALEACGLLGLPRTLLQVRRVRTRAAPLLYSPIPEAAEPDAPAPPAAPAAAAGFSGFDARHVGVLAGSAWPRRTH